MKKLFVFAALAVASALGAVDTALLKYLPAKSDGMAVIDVAKVSQHPEIKAALEAPDSVGAFQALGIAPKDVRDIAGFYAGEDFGVIVRVADSVALKAKLDASPMIKAGKTAVQIAAMDRNGVRVYRCNPQGSNEAVFAAFVAADVLAFAHSEEELEKYLQSPKFDGSRRFPDAEKAAAWGVYNNPDLRQDAEEGQIVSVEATLDVIGGESRDVVVAAVLNSDRDEYAAQLGMMLQGMFMMGCGMVFGDNPELGQKVTQEFKCLSSGKVLRLSLRITPEIASGIAAFAAKSAQEIVSADDPVQAAAPAPAAAPAGAAPAAK